MPRTTHKFLNNYLCVKLMPIENKLMPSNLIINFENVNEFIDNQ